MVQKIINIKLLLSNNLNFIYGNNLIIRKTHAKMEAQERHKMEKKRKEKKDQKCTFLCILSSAVKLRGSET